LFVNNLFFCVEKRLACERFLTFLPKLAEVLLVQIYIFLFKLSKQLKKNFFNYCKKVSEASFLAFFAIFKMSFCFRFFLVFVCTVEKKGSVSSLLYGCMV